MSLKHFHFVFIAASIVLTFLCGYWLIDTYRTDGGILSLLLGCGACAAGVALIFYGKHIIHKLNWIDMI